MDILHIFMINTILNYYCTRIVWYFIIIDSVLFSIAHFSCTSNCIPHIISIYQSQCFWSSYFCFLIYIFSVTCLFVIFESPSALADFLHEINSIIREILNVVKMSRIKWHVLNNENYTAYCFQLVVYPASFTEQLEHLCCRRLCEEDDELSEVEPDAVPSEVRDWLALTFTRSMSNMKRKGEEKPKFRSVAHAIRAGIMVDR